MLEHAFFTKYKVDKVLLQVAEAYFGEVLLRNDELVMMKTQDGGVFSS